MAENLDNKTIGRFPPRIKSTPANERLEMPSIPLAYTVNGRGEVSPLSVKSGWGYNNLDYSGSVTSPYSGIPIAANPAGYAYASTVSVWVARCIEIRSSAVSRIKREVISKKTKKPVYNHPYSIAVRRAHQQGQDIYALWERSTCVFGEVFLWPLTNQFGFKSDLKWLNNLGMNVQQGAGFIYSYSYSPITGGVPMTFEPQEIAHYMLPNWFNDLRGLSMLDSILLEIGIDKDMSMYTKAFFANDARPGLMLIPEVDLGEASAQQFMDYWKTNLQGAVNTGKPIMLPHLIKDIKEIQRPPNVDDVEIRESMRREICARFGVPLSVAGAWDDANYQSAPEQRRSLYEETIIPECDELDIWLTNAVLPYFDDTGEYEIKSDFTDVMALIEDESQKSDINTQRLISGGITRNEYRMETKRAPLPGEDVIYIPTGVNVVPVSQAGQAFMQPVPGMQPQGAPASAPVRPQQPVSDTLPPSTPPQAAVASKPADVPVAAKAEPVAQPSSIDELAAWKKKAMNGTALKAMTFICYSLPKDIEALVRGKLRPDMDKTALKAIFDEASETLKKNLAPPPDYFATPEEFVEYWGEYDSLMDKLGSDWLNLYMQPAFDKVVDYIGGMNAVDRLDNALEGLHNALAEQWLGTVENPGAVTQIILAGMGAANQAVLKNKPADPDKAVKAVTLNVDWNLLSKEAYEYAQVYTYNLIKNLDAETLKKVQAAVAQWIADGGSVDALRSLLEPIFKDTKRAALIAQTESTRIFNDGAQKRWANVGVVKMKFLTVRDTHVCPTCKDLYGQIGVIGQGWVLDGVTYTIPVHPGCRCFSRPVIDLENFA